MATNVPRVSMPNPVREQVAEEQNWCCKNCGNRLRAGYHIDHILPRCEGGANARENLQALCGTCHHDKTQKEKYSRAIAQIGKTRTQEKDTPQVRRPLVDYENSDEDDPAHISHKIKHKNPPSEDTGTDETLSVPALPQNKQRKSANKNPANEVIAGWMQFALHHMERGNYWHTYSAAYKEAYEEKSKMVDSAYTPPPPLPGKEALRQELVDSPRADATGVRHTTDTELVRQQTQTIKEQQEVKDANGERSESDKERRSVFVKAYHEAKEKAMYAISADAAEATIMEMANLRNAVETLVVDRNKLFEFVQETHNELQRALAQPLVDYSSDDEDQGTQPRRVVDEKIYDKHMSDMAETARYWKNKATGYRGAWITERSRNSSDSSTSTQPSDVQ